MFSFLKPGVGHSVWHALLTARYSSHVLIPTFPGHSPLFFYKPVPYFLTVLVLANAVCCVGPQNKISHPLRHENQLSQIPC